MIQIIMTFACMHGDAELDALMLYEQDVILSIRQMN